MGTLGYLFTPLNYNHLSNLLGISVEMSCLWCSLDINTRHSNQLSPPSHMANSDC